jgi:photosystem II stability/assembly factor-like uncharacterized protein
MPAAAAGVVVCALAGFTGIAVAMTRAHRPPSISKLHHEPLPESELSTHEDGAAPYGGWVASLAVTQGAPATVFASMSGGGLYRSDDFGATWISAGRGLPVWASCELTVDPGQSATVYASCYTGGLYKTTDRGRTWQQLDVEEPQQPVVALSDSRVVYEPPDGGTMLRSLDGGRTWRELTVDAGVARTDQFAVHPGDPFVLFMSGGDGVYKSRNGGRRWKSISLGLDPTLEIEALAIAPMDPDTIYVAGEKGVYRTTNGGALWTQTGALAAEGYEWHLQVLPSSSETVDAHVGDSVFRSDDGGTHWRKLTETLEGDVQSYIADPNNRSRLMAGTRMGVFVSTDEGRHWIPASNGIGRATVRLAIHGKPARVVASIGDGLFAQFDGREWRSSDDPGVFKKPLSQVADDPLRSAFAAHTGMPAVFVTVAPGQPSLAYASTSGLLQPKHVFRTIDGGRSWTFMMECSESIMPVSCKPVLDPSDPSTAYVVVLNEGIDEVMRTTDGGRTWEPLGIRNGSGLFELVAGDATRVFTQVVSNGTLHLVTSSDRGANWTIIDQGLPDQPIVNLTVMPNRPLEMFAAVENRGVFRTTDGQHWSPTR